MARSLNRVTLIGNLGQDPELRSLPSGQSVCKFTLATSESYKDKNGEWQEVTDWHNIVLWENLAREAGENLKKGSRAYVEGKIKNRSYEGKDGQKRYITEITATMCYPLVRTSTNSGESNYYGQGTRQESDTSFNVNEFSQVPRSLDVPASDPSIDDEVPF